MQYQSPNPMIMINNLNEDEKHPLRIKGAASEAMQQDQQQKQSSQLKAQPPPVSSGVLALPVVQHQPLRQQDTMAQIDPVDRIDMGKNNQTNTNANTSFNSGHTLPKLDELNMRAVNNNYDQQMYYRQQQLPNPYQQYYQPQQWMGPPQEAQQYQQPQYNMAPQYQQQVMGSENKQTAQQQQYVEYRMQQHYDPSNQEPIPQQYHNQPIAPLQQYQNSVTPPNQFANQAAPYSGGAYQQQPPLPYMMMPQYPSEYMRPPPSQIDIQEQKIKKQLEQANKQMQLLMDYGQRNFPNFPVISNQSALNTKQSPNYAAGPQLSPTSKSNATSMTGMTMSQFEGDYNFQQSQSIISKKPINVPSLEFKYMDAKKQTESSDSQNKNTSFSQKVAKQKLKNKRKLFLKNKSQSQQLIQPSADVLRNLQLASSGGDGTPQGNGNNNDYAPLKSPSQIMSSPGNQFSRDDNSNLRSNGTVSPAPHRTLDRTKNSDKLKQVLNQNQNQTIQNSLGQVNITYNLTSKQESETINRTRDFNLSPEAKTSEAKDLDSRNHALFSPGQSQILEQKINNPAFDSSPINEDDEYEGLMYQPTPQFIHDKNGGLIESSRVGTVQKSIHSSRQKSMDFEKHSRQGSGASFLNVPGTKKKRQETESDIDNELIKRNSGSGISNIKTIHRINEDLNEVNPAALDEAAMNEIDKFVMDQENEDEFMSNIEKQGIKVDDSTIYKYLQLDSRRSSRASQINHSISIKKDKNKQELIELDSPSIKEKKIKKLIEIVKEKQNSSNDKIKKESNDTEAFSPQLKHNKSLSSHNFSDYKLAQNPSEPSVFQKQIGPNFEEEQKGNDKLHSPSHSDRFQEELSARHVFSKVKPPQISIIEQHTPREKLQLDYKFKSQQNSIGSVPEMHLINQEKKSKIGENAADSLKMAKRISETTILIENLDQSTSPDKKNKAIPRNQSKGAMKNWSSLPILMCKKQNLEKVEEKVEEKIEEKEAVEEADNLKKQNQLNELMQQIEMLKNKAEELNKEINKEGEPVEIGEKKAHDAAKEPAPKPAPKTELAQIPEAQSVKTAPKPPQTEPHVEPTLQSTPEEYNKFNSAYHKQTIKSEQFEVISEDIDENKDNKVKSNSSTMTKLPVFSLSNQLTLKAKEIQEQNTVTEINCGRQTDLLGGEPQSGTNTSQSLNIYAHTQSTNGQVQVQHQMTSAFAAPIPEKQDEEQLQIQQDEDDKQSSMMSSIKQTLDSDDEMKQAKSKSLEKQGETLNELLGIQRKMTQDGTQFAQDDKLANQYLNDYKNIGIQPRPPGKSHYSVSTRSNQPSMVPSADINQDHNPYKQSNQLNMNIGKRSQLFLTQSQKVHQQFSHIFGSKFQGYHRHLVGKIIEQKMIMQENVTALKDIEKYMCMVNVKVSQALKDGLFHSQAKRVPNLMQTHDDFLFGEEAHKTLKCQPLSTQNLKQQNIQIDFKNELNMFKSPKQKPKAKQTSISPHRNTNTRQQKPMIRAKSTSNLKLIKRIIHDNRQRLQHFDLQKEEAQKIMNQEEEEKQNNADWYKQKLKEEQMNRKIQAEIRLKQKDLDRQIIQQKWKQQNKLQAELMAKKPMYKSMEEQFEIKKQNILNDEIKKVREEKKKIYKPIGLEEIDDFANKVDMIVDHLNQKRKQNRENEISTDFNPRVLQSNIYRQVLQNDKLSSMQKDMQIQELRERRDKKQNYANYIKMVHKPNIDKQKVDELKERIVKIKHPVKECTKYPASLPMRELKKILGQNRQVSGELIYSKDNASKETGVKSVHILPPLRPFALNKNRSPDFKIANGGKSVSPIKQTISDDSEVLSIQIKTLYKNNSVKQILPKPGTKQRRHRFETNSQLAHLQRVDEKMPGSSSRKPKDYLKILRENRLKKSKSPQRKKRPNNQAQSQPLLQPKNNHDLKSLRSSNNTKLSHRRTASERAAKPQSEDEEDFSKIEEKNFELLKQIKEKMAELDHKTSSQSASVSIAM